jgi:hypothetical protein
MKHFSLLYPFMSYVENEVLWIRSKVTKYSRIWVSPKISTLSISFQLHLVIWKMTSYRWLSDLMLWRWLLSFCTFSVAPSILYYNSINVRLQWDVVIGENVKWNKCCGSGRQTSVDTDETDGFKTCPRSRNRVINTTDLNEQ